MIEDPFERRRSAQRGGDQNSLDVKGVGQDLFEREGGSDENF